MRVKVPAAPEDPWNEGGRTTSERPYVVTAKLSTYLEERGLGADSYGLAEAAIPSVARDNDHGRSTAYEGVARAGHG